MRRFHKHASGDSSKDHDGGGLHKVWEVCTKPERKQLLILSFSGAVLNLGFGIVVPALPSLSESLGFGATGVGLILAAPALARVVLNLPAGAVAGRWGRVPCMAWGELVAAVGVFGVAVFSSLGAILPARFLGGGGVSLSSAGAAAYLADMTERKHLLPFRGTIIGAQGGLTAAAYAIGPALGGILTQVYGAQAALGGVGALTVACAGAFATLPETGRVSVGMQTSSVDILREAASDWKELLRDPNQQALFAANLALSLNYAALCTVTPLQAFHTFEATSGHIGGLFSIGAAVGIFLSPVAGQLADRYGRVPLVAPGVGLCVAGGLGVAHLQSWEAFVAAYIVWSIGEAIMAPALVAYAVDIAPKEKYGSALALPRQAFDISFLLAPPLLGLLYDAYPGSGPMTLTGLLTLMAGVFFHRVAKDVKLL